MSWNKNNNDHLNYAYIAYYTFVRNTIFIIYHVLRKLWLIMYIFFLLKSHCKLHRAGQYRYTRIYLLNVKKKYISSRIFKKQIQLKYIGLI